MNVPIDKYNQRVQKVNSLLCVGLDPEMDKLPIEFKEKDHPQFEFNKFIIEQTVEYAATFKPNIAFYESRGAAGLEDLKLTMEYLRSQHPDVFTICDAKRGDIGNTNEQYVREIFDVFGFDALTVQPYLGREAIEPFLKREDKVTIVLCRTSNPGAGEIQDLEVLGKPLWRVVAEKVVSEWNYNNNCMMVVGATYPEELKIIRSIAGDMPMLVPGVGAQGGDAKATLESGLTSEKAGLIINASRAIIFAGNPGQAAKELRDEINKYR